MNTKSDFDRRAAAWLADGPTELSDRVLDAALREVHLTHQRRRWSSPWRASFMSLRLGLAAAVALSVIAFGGALFFGGGEPDPTPTSSPAPVSPGTTPVAPTATPAPSGWATFTSAIYPRLDVVYPAGWSVDAPATRAWQAGDAFPDDDLPYADTFVSPGEGSAQIGLIVWEMPHDGDGGPDTFPLLKAWAERFCNEVLTSSTSCEDFTQDAVPMCRLLDDGCDADDGAILVPTAEAQYAFFRTWQYELFDSMTVRAVVIPREDAFPPAAPYGGSVALLKSILTHMGVWTPGLEPAG